jgi:hypothetical protein
LNRFNFGDDNGETDDVIVERWNDLLQLTFDVNGLNGYAGTPEIVKQHKREFPKTLSHDIFDKNKITHF